MKHPQINGQDVEWQQADKNHFYYFIKEQECIPKQETLSDKADQIVNNDRQSIYGHPYDDFGKVVELSKPILESNIDPRLKHALYMIQVKIARLLNSPDHEDSIIDIIGYTKTYEMVLNKLREVK